MATHTAIAPVFSASELAARALYRRAVEAAIWGMPIVSVDAMRQAFFRDGGAHYGDVLYFSRPADWKFQITTPNASSLYVYLNYNVKDGPVVIEVPAAVGAGLFGSLLDAWQTPIVDVGPAGEDQGEGGRYLILPPGWTAPVPPGYFVAVSATYNGYAALRAIPASRAPQDVARALALVRELRVYPLAHAADPPETRLIDIAGTLWDGIAHFDETFYDSLARMVNEELVQERDLVAMGMLRSLGIEKGKPFAPDDATRAILDQAILEAHATFMDAGTHVVPYWPDRQWGSASYLLLGAQTQFSYRTDSALGVDERAGMYYMACAAPRKLGAATMYLAAARDASGAALEGANAYRLRVPPDVPAKQFWAVTVYDTETAAFLRNAPTIEISSYQTLERNADGSADVLFAPRPPAGHESNWIFTDPAKPWMAVFRFYGPEAAIRDRTFKLPDIERVP